MKVFPVSTVRNYVELCYMYEPIVNNYKINLKNRVVWKKYVHGINVDAGTSQLFSTKVHENRILRVILDIHDIPPPFVGPK